MDEIQKINIKNNALLRARNYLLNQTPTDWMAVNHITQNIVDLTSNHLEAIFAPDIPQVPKNEQQQLWEAIEAFDENLKKKASADQILTDVKTIYALRPWPPGGTESGSALVTNLKPWTRPTSVAAAKLKRASPARLLNRPRSKA